MSDTTNQLLENLKALAAGLFLLVSIRGTSTAWRS
jgi:hypothetical protein